jgi:arylsulfatase A-like enzyme
MWFFGEYTAVDKLTATTIGRVARWANGQRRWPALLTCYFPGADSIAHEFGGDSPRYRRAIKHLDYQIGRICDWLEWQGLLDTTYLVLVSDHGMVPVQADGIIDLMTYIRETLGRDVTDRMLQDGSFEHRRRYFDRFDTVYVKSALRWATIHFAGSAGWDSRADPETVQSVLQTAPEGQRVWELPGIDLVVYAVSDREVVLRSPRGSAHVAERVGDSGLEYRYVPVPDDVLGYLADAELAAFVASGFHDSRAWLQATADHAYPDVVPHLVPLARCPRVGEVMLFAARGYSFGYEKGGHGGIDRQEVCIPMMVAGPGIEPGGTIEVARAVDVVPTLMTLLGHDLPEGDTLEGVPLFQPLPLPASGQDEGEP